MASTSRGRKRRCQQYLTDDQITNQIGTALLDEEHYDIEKVNGDANGWDDFDIDEIDFEEDAEEICVEESENEESETDEPQNVENETEDEGPHRNRRPRLKDRLVNSLQASLVSENHDDLALPVDKREVS